MYTGLQHTHSGLAYLALLALVLVIIWALVGALSGREFQEKDRKIALIAFKNNIRFSTFDKFCIHSFKSKRNFFATNAHQ